MEFNHGYILKDGLNKFVGTIKEPNGPSVTSEPWPWLPWAHQ